MGLTYKISATIPYDMCDVNGNVRVPQMMALAMQVSGMQSIEVGMADDVILERFGLVWIISDHTLEITRLPRFLENVVIETEAVSHNRYFCYRNFRIMDVEGNILMAQRTTFMLMDIETRKVQTVINEIVEAFQSEFVKKIIRMSKFKDLEHPTEKEFRVRFYDLDMNGHVNNGKYLEWVYESLSEDFLMNHVPTKIELKYVKEVMPGGLIQTVVELEEVDSIISHHEVHSDGDVNAYARMEWRSYKESEGEHEL